MNKNRISISEITVDKLKELSNSLIGIEDGKEYPNPTKNVLTGISRPPTLKEQIQRVLRNELSRQVQAQGYETFEESQDFDIEDDAEPLSGYEISEMVEEVPVEKPSEAPENVPEPAPENIPEPVEGNPDE